MSFGGSGGINNISGSTDVALSNPANTEVLTYVSSVGKWENKPAPSAVTATTSSTGTIQLAGDLAGTATSPVVAKVNGVTVTGTPSSSQVLTATSGTAATWSTPSGGGSGVPNGGTTGQLLRKNSSTDGDDGWSDYLHALSHGPGQPDATLQDRGDMSSTTFCPIPREVCANSLLLVSGNLYVSIGTAYSSFTATQLALIAGSPTGTAWTNTVAQFAIFTFDSSGNATQVATTANTTSILTSSNAVYALPLTSNYSIIRGTVYGIGFLMVGSGTTAPTVRAMSSNNALTSTGTSTLFGNVRSRYITAQASMPSSVAVGSWTVPGTASLPTLCLTASV